MWIRHLHISLNALYFPQKFCISIVFSFSWDSWRRNEKQRLSNFFFFWGGGGVQIIDNYWTWLSKISWFVSGEQINYLPKPKAEASNITDLRDTDKSRYFAITEFKDCFIIRPTSLFVMNLFGKRSDLSFFTQERPQEGEKRCFVYARAEYYLRPIRPNARPNTVGRFCAWADYYL